jgi:ribosomal protein S18 acetylase RimI-like enzyme
MSLSAQNHLLVEVQDEHFSKVEELLVLIQTTFAFMEDRIDPPSSMRLLTTATLAKKCKDETLFTVSDNNRLIGCAFAKEFEDYLYVGKVAIAQSHRGCGIGQRLIRACKSRAIECGKPTLEIQVRVELIENQHFFKKLGFVKSGETAHAGYTCPTSFTYRLNCKPAALT